MKRWLCLLLAVFLLTVAGCAKPQQTPPAAVESQPNPAPESAEQPQQEPESTPAEQTQTPTIAPAERLKVAWEADYTPASILETIEGDSSASVFWCYAQDTAQNVRLCAVEYNFDQGTYTETECLCEVDAMAAGDAVRVAWTLPDTVPNLMLSWKVSDGGSFQRLISESGEDGSILLLEPESTDVVEEDAAAPTQTATVTDAEITVAQTPGILESRPEFDPAYKIQEDEFASLHGYQIGMTLAETQKLYPLDQKMIDYAAEREDAEYPGLYIFVGNMAYGFEPEKTTTVGSYEDYVLTYIYYGETSFCENKEELNVVRNIRLGTTIEDALKAFPGEYVPHQWAIDQLYGQYGEPKSAQLEFSLATGSYTITVYGENEILRMSFGYSGKLWIAEVRAVDSTRW